jgi:hypothetical protein
MSSQAAPPPAKNGGNTSGRKTHKKRESKGQANQRQQLQPNQQPTTHAYHDELDDIEDQIITGNLKTRGRRGQISINHLLEFGLPRRDLAGDAYSRPVTRRPRRRSSNVERLTLNRAEFINANYRFVVDHRHAYRGQIMDPNLVLPDASILRVIVPRGHHCPICLDEDIIAPRMSSCGHIFCHSCLLSFLDSQPIVKKGYPVSRYKECPLCSNFVKPHEIKPVLINHTDERFEIPKVGQDVVMKLMARPNGDILPLPHGLNLNHKKIDNIPWYSDLEVYPYARIVKGGLKFSVDNYEREKREILKQYEEDKILYNDSDQDGKYVYKAIEEIDFQLKILREVFNDDYEEPNELLSLGNLSLKNNAELNDSNCSFFYQTSFNSTTRYFLSSLDTRIMLRTYGAYSNFPQTLLLTVENINYGLMVTETMLKKFKFMNHLPLGTELATLEVNWSSMKLPNDVYQEFKKDLVERQRKSKNKAKKEDTAKRNYENYQELKTLEFYQSEGNLLIPNDTDAMFYEDIPAVNQEHASSESDGPKEVVSTVWGTTIPKSSQIPTPELEDDAQDDWNFDELIKRSKEPGSSGDVSALGKKKKGKKKKLVLMASNGRGAY